MKIKDKLGAFDPRHFGSGFDVGKWVIDYSDQEDNPLYLWAILHICRRDNHPVPERVLLYLDDVARRLMELAARKERPERKASAEVYEALGMSKKGSRTPFDRLEIDQRNRLAAGRVLVRVMSGEKLTPAIMEVAEEMGMSDSSVRDAYYAAKDK